MIKLGNLFSVLDDDTRFELHKKYLFENGESGEIEIICGELGVFMFDQVVFKSIKPYLVADVSRIALQKNGTLLIVIQEEF